MADSRRAESSSKAPDGAISPLVPVLVPIAVAAILIGVVFSRLFPFSSGALVAPSVRFTDVTRDSGLDYIHDNGVQYGRDTPTTLPGAVAFLDYDNDGHPDLFFVSGTSWPWNTSAAGAAPTCALYHNNGSGHFTDVTKAAGLDINMLGMGVAVGDYDGAGFPDIFVTGIGGNRLFHNNGNGTFTDVTDEAGVRGDDHVWSSGAVWIDIFGNGRLDLVVCNYARWARETDLQGAFAAEIAGPSYTAPAGFVSVFPTVYRNLGKGKFAEVSAKTGLNLIDRQTGYPRANPLAVAAVDANGDGRLDLLFTYQSGGDILFLNQGDGTFRQWTPRSEERREGSSAGFVGGGALAYSRQDRVTGRFGILRAAGLAMAPVSDEGDTYCRLSTKLGVALLDYDLDGRMDIVTANGLAEPALAHFEHGRSFDAAPSLLWNNGQRWVKAPNSPDGKALGEPVVGRGVAVADVRGTGTLDVVVAQNGGPPRLLRNDQRSHNAWLRIDLVGTRCQRDAGGARVEVDTPRAVLVQTMEPAMGFMAQSEKTLTFGLGGDDRVRKIVVRWPDGAVQEVRPAGFNRRIVITEPL
ncbi:MAG TPA: CRTAC1 family protein [Opitutaceae bacterium]